MVNVYSLSKHFGDKIAVDKISFSVNRGEILGILGPNGAGKTTILRLLSCLISPTEGKAEIFGYDILKDQIKIRNIVGVLPEFPFFYPRMKISEYLVFFAKLYGLSEEIFKKRIEKFYKIFEIRDENSMIENLSKGTKQKISLMRALLHNPELILLDEPTSALDPENSKIVRDYIISLKNDGKIVIVATHNLSEAEFLSDRIAIIKEGKIIFLDTPFNLKKKLLGEEKFLIEYFSSDCIRENLYYLLENFLKKENLPLKIIHIKNREIVFSTTDKIKTNPKLLEFLQRQNVRIVSCKNISISLEEAYLNLVKNI